jgi:hypothetical protein
MRDNKEMMCDECKMNVPSSDIKYTQKGDKVLKMCLNCRDRTTTRKSKELPNKKFDINIIHEKKPVKKQMNSGNVKEGYFCTRCKYKFNYDSNKEGKLKCPYCSSSAYVTSAKSLSSNKLLNEANNFD